MRGKVLIIGDMEIDGEKLRGVFVECTVNEICNCAANIYDKEVEIVPEQEKEFGKE